MKKILLILIFFISNNVFGEEGKNYIDLLYSQLPECEITNFKVTSKNECKASISFPEESSVKEFHGRYLDGKATGEGLMVLREGSKIAGNFVNNMLDGEVAITYSNGDYFAGTMLADKKHGIGKYRNSKGEDYSGHWENGERLSFVELNKLRQAYDILNYEYIFFLNFLYLDHGNVLESCEGKSNFIDEDLKTYELDDSYLATGKLNDICSNKSLPDAITVRFHKEFLSTLSYERQNYFEEDPNIEKVNEFIDKKITLLEEVGFRNIYKQTWDFGEKGIGNDYLMQFKEIIIIISADYDPSVIDKMSYLTIITSLDFFKKKYEDFGYLKDVLSFIPKKKTE